MRLIWLKPARIPNADNEWAILGRRNRHVSIPPLRKILVVDHARETRSIVGFALGNLVRAVEKLKEMWRLHHTRVSAA